MTTAKKLLTADDLLAMPDNGMRQELARGELIEMPPPGFMHHVVTGRIGFLFSRFVEERGLNFYYGPEAPAFFERAPDTVRAADFALVDRNRIQSSVPASGYIFGLVPDLVVEVISPGYRSQAAVQARVRMWLDAGVRLVVVAYIATQEIITHGDDGRVERFGPGDTLTCEPVLPGFACTVDEIFAC